MSPRFTWLHRSMIILLFVAFIVYDLFVPPQKAEAETFAPGGSESAMWVWDPGLLNGGWEQLLEFASQQDVNRIYFGVDITIKPYKYQPFVRKAHESGIAVEAVSGRASWVFHENRSKMLDYARWVVAYNAAVAPEERFTAARLDLEPHQLAEWKTDRDRLTGLWAETAAQFSAEIHKTPGLSATADVPFWLDGYLVPGTAQKMHDFMIATFDEVTIMAYRNFAEGPNGILNVVASELESARLAGKKLTIGLETKYNNEAPYVSFYGMSRAYMQNEQFKVYDILKDDPAFAGFSVHEYKAWTNIKP